MGKYDPSGLEVDPMMAAPCPHTRNISINNDWHRFEFGPPVAVRHHFSCGDCGAALAVIWQKLLEPQETSVTVIDQGAWATWGPRVKATPSGALEFVE